MKKYIITFLITIYSLTAYCQHYKQDLQSVAQITFPDTPKIEQSGGASYYIYRSSTNDLYFSQVIDLNKINPDSLNLKKTDAIYSQFINTVLKPIKGEIIQTKGITLDKIKGISFDYKCKLNGNTYYGYQQAFRLNDVLVSYSLLSPDSLQANNEKIKSYFTSFKLTPEKASNLNQKSSILAGALLIGAIIFWTLIAIFIYKKVTKKKTYQWPDEN